ncbi:MAG TPA: hypothetical protein VJT31_19650, partial [Rugosimonospora sp.]|nr:hypothetical protein [Rugosimonospora sp.]
MRPTTKDLPDQASEGRTGAHLHEGTHTRGVHCLDHVDEGHRYRELGGEEFADPLRIGGVRGRVGVPEDGQPGGAYRDGAQVLQQRLARGGDERAVEGGAGVQAGGGDPLGGEPGGHGVQGGYGAGEHDLARAVVVGEPHAGLAGHRGLDPVAGRADREHAAGLGRVPHEF